MSTTSQHPETYECAECSNPRTRQSSIRGSFCSRECHARHRGRGILRELERDHKYCYTCFARLKTLEEPSEKWTRDKDSRVLSALQQGAKYVPGAGGQPVLDATQCEYSEVVDTDQIIGLQYGTEHATTGVIENRVDDYLVLERTGLICRCGNTHHSNRETVIQDTNIVDVARNLIGSIQALRREGVHDHKIAPQVLVQELRDQVGDDGWDFALAVGKAIQE